MVAWTRVRLAHTNICIASFASDTAEVRSHNSDISYHVVTHIEINWLDIKHVQEVHRSEDQMNIVIYKWSTCMNRTTFMKSEPISYLQLHLSSQIFM